MKTKDIITKSMLLLFAIACTSFSTFAQNDLCENNLLINGDFNSSTCNNIGTNCVPNWYNAAFGTPDIFGIGGDPYAWMWSYGGGGEAIYANFPFVANTTYNISFRVRTDDLNTGCTIVADFAKINLIATNSAGAPTSTPGGQIIFQGSAAPYLNIWTTITAQFTPTAAFSKLWVFPFMQQSGSNCQVEMSIDDICITQAYIAGAYCCDSINLVANGNFESGNFGFGSDYTNNPAVFPGQYNVTNSAAAFGAIVTDHSYCVDPIIYAANENYLLVNGKTQQPGNPNAFIWEQTISGLDSNSTYKFCAYFKNMPQCTFDTLPIIYFEVDASFYVPGTPISAGITDCAWINKEINFTAMSTSATLRIYIDQTWNGDGNDLAIDDISVTKLIDPEISITVQHQGNPDQILASVNTIDSNDDGLHCADLEYEWRVAEVISYSPTNIVTGSFTVNTAPLWNLTTTFQFFSFDPTKMYMIVLYTPACDCYDEGYTFQLTYNFRPMAMQMTPEQELSIIESIRNGTISNSEIINATQELNDGSDELIIYPNPVENSFTISLKDNSLKSVEVLSLTGQTLLSKKYSDAKAEEILDISQLASGIYLVKAYAADNTQYITKVVKE